MADAQVALEGGQSALVEHLGDQPELPVDEDPLAVGNGHPGGLLATVLEREQSEVGEPGYVLSWRPNAEEAASFARAFPSHWPRS